MIFQITYLPYTSQFTQNSLIGDLLLLSRDSQLVYANVDDSFWGVALEPKDEKCYSQDSWRGTNRLGKILALVRSRLNQSKNGPNPQGDCCSSGMYKED